MQTATSSTHSQFIQSSGVDADRIFNATVGQRSYILQQLEEAERNARDALFALEMMEMELSRETAAIKSTLSRLSETLPPHKFDKMCDFAFSRSKEEWENVWKHEWVDDGNDRDRFIEHPRGPSKKSRPDHRPSTSLPPSSPSPLTSPVNSRGHLPPRATPVSTNRVPWDECQRPTGPRSPLPPDGLRVPWGFVERFGPTRYRPTPSRAQQSRRLKRDKRQVVACQDGTLTIFDPQEDIEAQRREIKEMMRLQARQRLSAKAQSSERSLLKIVQTSATDRIQGPPVTWSNVFGDGEPPPEELANPFAQSGDIPPMYPDLHQKRPERDDE